MLEKTYSHGDEQLRVFKQRGAIWIVANHEDHPDHPEIGRGLRLPTAVVNEFNLSVEKMLRKANAYGPDTWMIHNWNKTYKDSGMTSLYDPTSKIVQLYGQGRIGGTETGMVVDSISLHLGELLTIMQDWTLSATDINQIPLIAEAQMRQRLQTPKNTRCATLQTTLTRSR